MSWFTKALGAMRHTPHRAGFLGHRLRRTKVDYRREVGDMLDSSVVTAPVGWIARALPEARLTLRKRGRAGQIAELPDHPMAKLVATPNSYYGAVALWSATVWSHSVAGNAYWIKVRNGAGRVVELWYVPHWLIEPVGSADGSEFLTHYIYRPGGQEIHLAPDDVVHFRAGIDPRNPRLGLSPMGGVIREIFMDLESSNFVSSLLRNMGVPGVVISPKSGPVAAPDDVSAVKAWFTQAFGGDNRGGPLVMGAPTDVVPFGFNPQQMNMSEARDVAEERVCACLGLPPAVVGFGAGLQSTKVGATMTEMRKLAWHNAVLPLARALADELTRSLLRDFPGADNIKVAWDTTEVLALGDEEDKKSTRTLAQLAAGMITVAEARGELGWEVDTSHQIYLRPAMQIEVPATRSSPTAKSFGQKARASSSAMRASTAYVTALERAAPGLRRAFEDSLSRFFKGLGEAAAEAARAELGADDSPKSAPAGETKSDDDELISAILRRLGIAAHQTTFRRVYEAQYLSIARATARAGELAGLGASLPDPVARAVIGAGGRRSGLVDLDAQTRKALFDALALGRAEGEGATQLAARIGAEVEGGPWASLETRARTIARTETKYAQNVSTLERARDAGVSHFVVFDGRLGEGRSKPDHIARHGSIVTAEEAAQMADEEHPNGTLSFAPHFGDADQDDEE